jgi:hypothetical protein
LIVMSGTAGTSFLDGKGARLVALGVLIAVGALLLRIHWADFFPPPQAELSKDDPVAICMAERAAGIDKMLADGVIDENQARQFKGRAEALCQAQEGGGSGPPPLPTN